MTGGLLPVLIVAAATTAAAKRSDKEVRDAKDAREPKLATTGPLAQLRKGHAAFRAGQYESAAKLLAGLDSKLPRVRDYVLYLAAESEFYAGRPARARPLYTALEKQTSSRLAPLAGYRVADCLWAEGDRASAAARYRKLLGPTAEGERRSERNGRVKSNTLTASGNYASDLVVARFRVATMLEEQPKQRERAYKAWKAIHVEFPSHPLADQAAARAAALASGLEGKSEGKGEGKGANGGAKPDAAAAAASPEDRLTRAETLAEERLFDEAVAEIGKLPANLSPELAVERDYLLGMTRYKMRQPEDYQQSARLLLGVVDKLSGEKAASAAYHGTRALSRVNRDNEAIAGYRKLVERFPTSRWAAEAQFRSGWLEVNRGRFREGLPGLEETVKRFPRTEYGEDAAWFVALAHVVLGEGEPALAALDRYAKMAASGKGAAAIEAGRRAQYFRARALALLGKQAQADELLRELTTRNPFGYYGLLARARLRERGAPPKLELPSWSGRLPAADPGRDALVARADDLFAAGLEAEAGIELYRGDGGLLSRLGRERALAVLFDRYPRFQQWRRAYQLADAYGDEALESAPRGPARSYWEAAYPRAFPDLVDRFGKPAGNPEYFLISIIRKESGYLPTETSYADARGLVQLIPPTAALMAKELNVPFSAEQLWVPEVSVQLGAHYLGALAKKFKGNVALAAGAYNAGSRPMMTWCDRNGRRPLDEFVELVTYEQSREYIKRVLGIYARYQYLYEDRPWDPPLGLAGCQYLPGGPAD